MFLYPSHVVRGYITGPGECRKSQSLTNLIFYSITEFEKINLSPSLHRVLCQKLIKCFDKYIPNVSNEENLDFLIDGKVKKENFEMWETEIETFKSIEEKNILRNMMQIFQL